MTGVEVGQGHSGLLPLEVPCVSGSQSIPRAFRHMPKAVRSQTTVTVDTEPFLNAGPHISEPCLRDGISPVCISGNNILSDISEFTLYCQTHSIELLSALPVSFDNEGTLLNLIGTRGKDGIPPTQNIYWALITYVWNTEVSKLTSLTWCSTQERKERVKITTMQGRKE